MGFPVNLGDTDTALPSPSPSSSLRVCDSSFFPLYSALHPTCMTSRVLLYVQTTISQSVGRSETFHASIQSYNYFLLTMANDMQVSYIYNANIKCKPVSFVAVWCRLNISAFSTCSSVGGGSAKEHFSKVFP